MNNAAVLAFEAHYAIGRSCVGEEIEYIHARMYPFSSDDGIFLETLAYCGGYMLMPRKTRCSAAKHPPQVRLQRGNPRPN